MRWPMALGKSITSSQLSLVLSLIAVSYGWWIVALSDT
jgi:hypothetical protein